MINSQEQRARPPAGRAGAGRGARLRRAGAAARRVAARVPARWAWTFGVFVAAKLVLTLVGVVALHAFDGVPGAPPGNDTMMRAQQQAVSPYRWISMWTAWDSFLYDHLSRIPLHGPWREFGLPLLYPFLARPFAAVLGGSNALALLLVSNIALLFALYYAHGLGTALLGNETSARRFSRYLVLLPTAFLFQAALTESVFVCLALAAFHYAERQRWLLVGIVGYFLALTRSVGFLVVIPLALVLLRQHGYRLGPRALWGHFKAGWPLVLLPLGWLTFMAFGKWQGGDWFAYTHAQEQGWGITVQNPLTVLRDGLITAQPRDAVRVWFAVAVLGIVVAGFRRVELPYLAYTLIMVLVPLSMGPAVYQSLLRYLLAAFPVGLVLARWSAKAPVDTFLTAALALLQGALFVIWLTYWTHFII